MKFKKTSINAKLYPFLGVFMGISSLISLNSPLKAMELSTYSGQDEITVDDQETIMYVCEPQKTKKGALKRAACTHPGCTHVASSKSNLSQHMMRHTKSKRFTCPMQGCNYSAHFACHIRAHMKKTHKAE